MRREKGREEEDEEEGRPSGGHGHIPGPQMVPSKFQKRYRRSCFSRAGESGAGAGGYRGGPGPGDGGYILTVSLLILRNITQTYKHMPPPPPTTPPPTSKGGEGQAPPFLWGGKGGGGEGGVVGREGAYVYTSV